MNIGERNELLIKLRLVEMRMHGMSAPIFGGDIVRKVGFGKIEYLDIPAGTGDYTQLDDAALLKLAGAMNIAKAGIFDKADVYINGIGYSIKSLSAAPPALVNHTARDGWERVCACVGCSIQELDDIVAEYWKLRTSGEITEDVPNSHPKSPFASHKDYLLPILNYYLFKGSGSRSSVYPADYILDFTDPTDESTWKKYGADYINSHWNKLVFSLRSSKGMGNYPNIKNVAKKASMAKWTVFHSGGHKGALHVRVTK